MARVQPTRRAGGLCCSPTSGFPSNPSPGFPGFSPAASRASATAKGQSTTPRTPSSRRRGWSSQALLRSIPSIKSLAPGPDGFPRLLTARIAGRRCLHGLGLLVGGLRDGEKRLRPLRSMTKTRLAPGPRRTSQSWIWIIPIIRDSQQARGAAGAGDIRAAVSSTFKDIDSVSGVGLPPPDRHSPLTP